MLFSSPGNFFSKSWCFQFEFWSKCHYAIRRLTDYIDDTITQYLSFGDPKLCCEKLENLLTQGLLYKQLEGTQGREVKSQPTIKLHPLHYLCLNAYTTLASAYKVRSKWLVGSIFWNGWASVGSSGLEQDQCSILIIACRCYSPFVLLWIFYNCNSCQFLDKCWGLLINSFLKFCMEWVCKMGSAFANPPILKCICSKCSLMDNFKAILFHREAQNADFEDISSEFLDCVTIITQKVWSFLNHGCYYFREFKDPIDFSWFGTSKIFQLKGCSASSLQHCWRTWFQPPRKNEYLPAWCPLLTVWRVFI